MYKQLNIITCCTIWKIINVSTLQISFYTFCVLHFQPKYNLRSVQLSSSKFCVCTYRLLTNFACCILLIEADERNQCIAFSDEARRFSNGVHSREDVSPGLQRDGAMTWLILRECNGCWWHWTGQSVLILVCYRVAIILHWSVQATVIIEPFNFATEMLKRG